MNRQYLSVIALLLLFATTVRAEEAWSDFQLRSYLGFIVQGEVEGRVLLDDRCVCFDVHEVVLRTPPELETAEEVVGVRLGLARYVDGGEWAVYGYAKMREIPVMLSAEAPVVMSPFRVSMSLPDGFDPAQRYWVVMEVVLAKEGGGYASTFAQEVDVLREMEAAYALER